AEPVWYRQGRGRSLGPGGGDRGRPRRGQSVLDRDRPWRARHHAADRADQRTHPGRAGWHRGGDARGARLRSRRTRRRRARRPARRGGLPPPRVRALDDLRALLPLALIIAIVVMMQAATAIPSFAAAAAAAGHEPDLNRDFVGLGAGNLFAAVLGAFPVNAS